MWVLPFIYIYIPLGRQKSLGLAPQHFLPLTRHLQGRQGPPRSAGLRAAQETHRARAFLAALVSVPSFLRCAFSKVFSSVLTYLRRRCSGQRQAAELGTRHRGDRTQMLQRCKARRSAGPRTAGLWSSCFCFSGQRSCRPNSVKRKNTPISTNMQVSSPA